MGQELPREPKFYPNNSSVTASIPKEIFTEIYKNYVKEENYMLSASEAKKKTLNNIKECTTKELSMLEKQINQAISNGKFAISNDGCLQSETKERLTELGYKVITGSQRNEYYYSISWN